MAEPEVSFHWQVEHAGNLVPVYGFGVVMALDEDGEKVLTLCDIGEPDAFTVYGLLQAAATDARKATESYFDEMEEE